MAVATNHVEHTEKFAKSTVEIVDMQLNVITVNTVATSQNEKDVINKKLCWRRWTARSAMSVHNCAQL